MLNKMELCCENCFCDQYLKNYIQVHGIIGNCTFCDSMNIHCIKPTELAFLFKPVVYLYSPVENFMPMEDKPKHLDDLKDISDKLQDDWGIFNFNNLPPGKHKSIMHAISPDNSKEGTPSFLTGSAVEREDAYWGTDWERSYNLEKLWKDFCHELKFGNRFFPKKEFNYELMSELISILSIEIKAKSTFFRARKSDNNKKLPCSEMGKPLAENSKDGRANPKGIPYLYLASDIDTAISEIRPTIKQIITTGKFCLKKGLTVIDLRDPKIDSPFRHGEILGNALNYLEFLRKLGLELSKTVHERNSELEYLPLQYLCELIKSRHYAGIIYNSSVGYGYNLVIFDGSEFECISTELYEINKIQMEYKRLDS